MEIRRGPTEVNHLSGGLPPLDMSNVLAYIAVVKDPCPPGCADDTVRHAHIDIKFSSKIPMTDLAELVVPVLQSAAVVPVPRQQGMN